MLLSTKRFENHEPLGMWKWLESHLRVQIMRIAGREKPASQVLMLRMLQREPQHLVREAVPAMLRVDEHIRDPRERRAIRDDAQISNLKAVEVGADDER